MVGLYRGYSSRDFTSGVVSKGKFPSANTTNDQPFQKSRGLEYTGTNTLKLYDIPLVERNILNHINTGTESRVMMSAFGSNIPKLLFQPLDDTTIEEIKLEIQKVVNYDPRVELKQMLVTPIPDKNTVTVTLFLYYIELKVTKNMNFNLDFRS